MSEPFELPLFPLDMVLLPFHRVPLHIFEERYKLMVNTCLDDKTEFGIVWGTDDDFREIGCAARVTDRINRFPDGRMNILVRGTRAVRILERFDLHPYISGRVEEIPDEPEVLDLALGERVGSLYREAQKLSLEWLNPKQEGETDLSKLSYTVAANLSLPLPDQQAILETPSANERLQTVSKNLESALQRMRIIKKRTGGNGHLA